MYTIRVQRFDCEATGSDEAQGVSLETVGRVESATAARAYAQMWQRYASVAAVWVEADYRSN